MHRHFFFPPCKKYFFNKQSLIFVLYRLAASLLLGAGTALRAGRGGAAGRAVTAAPGGAGRAGLGGPGWAEPG